MSGLTHDYHGFLLRLYDLSDRPFDWTEYLLRRWELLEAERLREIPW